MRMERDAWSANGLLTIALILLLIYLVTINIFEAQFIFVFLFCMIIIILVAGLTIVKPNEAKVILLFGKYLGTVRQEGLIYTVPFTKRKRMSLKINTFETKMLIQLPNKTVDVHLILFYKVVDTAKVLFEVEQVERYIQLQGENILKSLLINYYPSVVGQQHIVTNEIREQFLKILQDKLNKLGIEITELYIVQ